MTIRTIPTLVLFFDGVAKDKILGFNGLCEGLEAGHEDEWRTIVLARLLGSKGIINEDNVIDEDQIEEEAKRRHEAMRMQAIRESMLNFGDEDLDLEE